MLVIRTSAGEIRWMEPVRLLTPALSSFEEERERILVNGWSRVSLADSLFALGYLLSGCQPCQVGRLMRFNELREALQLRLSGEPKRFADEVVPKFRPAFRAQGLTARKKRWSFLMKSTTCEKSMRPEKSA